MWSLSFWAVRKALSNICQPASLPSMPTSSEDSKKELQFAHSIILLLYNTRITDTVVKSSFLIIKCSHDITDPQNLAIECTLNNDVMQKSSTKDMIFSVAEIISFLSQSATLLPGTLILTGTPEGVGFTRKPPVYLKPGDVLKTRVEKIGTLENKVVSENKTVLT